ncbi:MAG: amino acid adenylation domain-containing protein, partial [bacterium]|nr:amino acid adenylation domain-containing protein [bacterium]
IKNPTQRVEAVDMLSADEKHRLLEEFNATEADYPREKTMHRLFEEQAARTPDSIALVGEITNTGNGSVTYNQLDRIAGGLARYLMEKGVEPGMIVAVMLPRSLELVIGILGVLKAGGAFLPIDSNYPQERIDFMLRDSASKVIITNDLMVDGLDGWIVKKLDGSSGPTDKPTNLAYIIYTSGSTGKPKGVMLQHQGMLSLKAFHQHRFNVDSRDRIIQFASSSFDASVWEIFMALLNGAALHMLSSDIINNYETFESYITRHGITIATLPPIYADRLNPHKLKSIRLLITAGSAPTAASVHRWAEKTRYINAYGPTETTICATLWDATGNLENDSFDVMPIGKPISNTQVYILGAGFSIQPIGVPGELCVSGIGLARGYLNRPELTHEKFEVRTSNVELSFTLYHTGDLARWLPDGNIEFMGRIDHQVKIRGFRIEPGEIEDRLTRHESVKDAVVIDRDTAGGEKYLCAYITVTTGDDLQDSRIRDYLSGYFPDYMVPAFFVMLDHMPLTPSGKVDRKALPEPRITKRAHHIPPRDETERQLAEIWSDLLEMEAHQIGIDDNFFQIGGHSLKAVTHLNRVHKAFDIQLPLSRFFTSPTIKEVATFIKEARKITYQTIKAAEEKEYYPLTNPQKRFFLFQRLEPGDTSYNMPDIMLLEGAIEKERFQNTFKRMIRRHESLRSSFHMVAGEPVQIVSPVFLFAMEFHDLTGLQGAVKTREKERTFDEFVKPFNLTRPPLLRSGLVKMEEDIHFLMIDMHHIISDGVSMGIFVKEFLALYTGEELPLPHLHYKDYAEWKRKIKNKETHDPLPGSTAAQTGGDLLNLPCDYPRPPLSTFAGSLKQFKLGEHETGALNSLALHLDVSLYVLLLAVFNVFLAKLSGQEDIAVGSPMAGRDHYDLQELIGLFINTLVLRNAPAAQKTFSAFLKEVKANALDAFENQDIQYEQLMEVIIDSRDTGRNPLFDVMFVLQNMEIPKVEFPGLKVTREAGEQKASKFDLTIYVEEPEDFPIFKVEYNTRLFKEETILRFTRYFKTILSSILEDPGQKIADIDCIPRSEKEQLLVRFNQSAADCPKDTAIYRLFEEQAEKTPNAAVLRSGNRELNYSQLNRRANQLAHMLRNRGVGANQVVGIMFNRSMELIETLFAVLKAGATYLPVDPEYPGSRIIFMLKDSKSSLLITQREILEGKQLGDEENSPGIIVPAELTGDIARQPRKNPEPLNRPDDLTYIIFTSGSTGVPKGAGVFHRSTVNLVNWFVTDFGLNPGDTGIFLTSFSFDLTQKTIYGSCISGGVLIVPTTRHFDPQVILKEIWETGVTWTNCTPSMFAKLLEYCIGDELRQLERLRWVFLGGEPFVINTYLKWLESDYCNAEIVNTYGPTECSDITSSYRIQEPPRFLHSPIPIGKPVYNVQIYILDTHRKILPIGIPGECCIAGAGVGIGYVNDKQLTSEKFITVPIGGRDIRLYRTGDLVKWLPDGNAVFLGRFDHQVKIRGFRIELGEIEKQLLDHEDIKEALVMARKQEDGDSYLCAYIIPVEGDIVPDDKTGLTPNALKEFLINELPDYMIPSYFVILDGMPLNPNGKVDRKSLPEPDISHGISVEYVPPANKTEEQLVALWSEVLGPAPDRIGVNANFFQLGGHSLKAAGLIAAIHKDFSVEIPIAGLFEAPTIRGISQLIAKTNPGNYSSIQPIEETEYYPLSSAQKRLFVIYRLDPSTTTYNLPQTFHLKG